MLNNKRFILRAQDTELWKVETEDVIDPRTTATHALIYACWWTDIELVMWIIQDLRELIDINTLIDDKNVLEWTFHQSPCSPLMVGHTGLTAILTLNQYVDKTRIDDAANICRYLIVCYGLQLDANRPGGHILRTSILHHNADIVAYLITVYSPNLSVEGMAIDIFRCLAWNDQDEATETYLGFYRDQLLPSVRDVLESSAYAGSTYIFRLVLDIFQSDISHLCTNQIFNILCDKTFVCDRFDKTRVALDAWADQLSPETIEASLVNCWGRSLSKRHGTWNDNDVCSRTAQMIVEACMDKLENRGIEIALVCCFPVLSRTSDPLRLPQNLKLFDAVLESNLEQIIAKPRLMRHTLLECCIIRDIDTFAHILAKCGSCIYPSALMFWCQAGDLKAVMMLFEVGAGCDALIDAVPKALVSACSRGDLELEELLIELAGDSILDSTYQKAFSSACLAGHESIIRSLAAHIDHHLDSDLKLEYIEPSIISLLNDIFGTSYDPECGGKKGHVDESRDTNHSLMYGGSLTAMYRL